MCKPEQEMPDAKVALLHSARLLVSVYQRVAGGHSKLVETVSVIFAGISSTRRRSFEESGQEVTDSAWMCAEPHRWSLILREAQFGFPSTRRLQRAGETETR